MKKYFLFLCMLNSAVIAFAQDKPFVKKDTFASKTNQPATIKKSNVMLASAVPVEDKKTESIYSLTAAKLVIRNGNDNKENASKFLFYLWENSGVWGEGKGLYTQPNVNESVKELKANSEFELPLVTPGNVDTKALTLSNLQNKGFRFTIYYYPGFILDEWKIESVTLKLEFKDQFGRLHPTMGNRTIWFQIANGTLSSGKSVMTGITDVFFTPQPVTITAN